MVVSAVAGLAGVGKTTLAVAGGARGRCERGWFGGGVLFIDLHGYDEAPVEPGQALDALLRALGVPAEHIPPGAEERAGLYRSVLAQISEPVLVIADNASSEAQVRPLLPGAGPHKVLVTSRHTLAGLGARLVDVTVLDEAAASRCWMRRCAPPAPMMTGSAATRRRRGRLAGVCGGLPLALQITAALLNADPALSAGELADELADENGPAGARCGMTTAAGPAAPSVAAAFELSYRRLDDDRGAGVPAAAGQSRARMCPPLRPRCWPICRPARCAGCWRAWPARTWSRPLPAGRAGGGCMTWCACTPSGSPTIHAEADGREQARTGCSATTWTWHDAADDHLRALPGMAVPAGVHRPGRCPGLAGCANGPAWSPRSAWPPTPAGTRPPCACPLLLAEYLAWRRRFDDWLAVTTISLNAARRLGDRHSEGTALTNLGIALRRGAAVRGSDHRAPGRRRHLPRDRRPAQRSRRR